MTASSDTADASRRPHIVYFAFDSSNEGIRRRINEALRAGYQITLFSFRRARSDKGAYQIPDSDQLRTIDLGETSNAAYAKRIAKLLHAAFIIIKNRRELRTPDVIVTRNIDMAVLALMARFFAGRARFFIYEVLDVQPAMTGKSAASRFARAIEGFVLRRSDALIVSSPGFLRNYFNVYFRHVPRSIVIENKISFPAGASLPERVPPPALDAAKPVWTIGWFGKFRCRTSLQILTELARKMPDNVRIYVRGYPDAITSAQFEEAIAGLPNVVFEGSYRTPGDLQDMMAKIHFNWCVDMSNAEGNSSWLLPNRIYEGGYFAIPAIAIEGTETGEYVRRNALGPVLASGDFETLAQFIRDLTPQNYLEIRAALNAAPADRFVDSGEFHHLLDDMLAASPSKAPAMPL